MKPITVLICFSIAILGAITLMFLLFGCGGGGGSTGGGDIIYSGPLYGDFIAVYDQVKGCKGYQGNAQPTITIYAHPFQCNESQMGGGCFWEPNRIGMVGPKYSESGDHNNLIDTQGALFSHELAHFLQYKVGQSMNESDPCATFELTNFTY